MDEASWLALTATLTLIAGAWTVYAARNRGAASALRGAGFTLLVPALYLTNTLDTIVDIGAEIASWATRLVFSPTVWLGVVLAGIAAVCFGASSVLRSREVGRAESGEPPAAPAGRDTTSGKELPPKRGSKQGSGDDELDEIEELLRRRGIT